MSKAIFGPAGRSEVNSTLIQSVQATQGPTHFYSALPFFLSYLEPLALSSLLFGLLSDPNIPLQSLGLAVIKDVVTKNSTSSGYQTLDRNMFQSRTLAVQGIDTSFCTFTRKMSERAKASCLISVKLAKDKTVQRESSETTQHFVHTAISGFWVEQMYSFNQIDSLAFAVIKKYKWSDGRTLSFRLPFKLNQPR